MKYELWINMNLYYYWLWYYWLFYRNLTKNSRHDIIVAWLQNAWPPIGHYTSSKRSGVPILFLIARILSINKLLLDSLNIFEQNNKNFLWNYTLGAVTIFLKPCSRLFGQIARHKKKVHRFGHSLTHFTQGSWSISLWPLPPNMSTSINFSVNQRIFT